MPAWESAGAGYPMSRDVSDVTAVSASPSWSTTVLDPSGLRGLRTTALSASPTAVAPSGKPRALLLAGGQGGDRDWSVPHASCRAQRTQPSAAASTHDHLRLRGGKFEQANSIARAAGERQCARPALPLVGPYKKERDQKG